MRVKAFMFVHYGWVLGPVLMVVSIGVVVPRVTYLVSGESFMFIH